MPWPWGQKNPVVGVRPKSPFGIPARATTPTPNDAPASNTSTSSGTTKPRSVSDASSVNITGSRSGSALGHRRGQNSRSSRPRRGTNEEETDASRQVSIDGSDHTPQQSSLLTNGDDTGSPLSHQPPQLKPQRMSRPFGDMFTSELNFRLINGSGSDIGTSSPAPSSPGISVTRSQKAIMPPQQLRNGSEASVQRQRQIQEEEDEMITDIRDQRSNAVVSPAPSTTSSTLSNTRSKEARLEAEVLKLRKLVTELKDTHIRGPPTPISPPNLGNESSHEAHRVAQVLQVAFDQLKRKYDSLSEVLKERTNELNRLQTVQFTEIDDIRQASQVEKQNLIKQHACELESARLASMKQINELTDQLACSPEKLSPMKEKTRLLEAEVEEWKNREKTLLQNYERMMDEMKRKHDADIAATKKRFDEAQAEWESKVEDMRREIDAEKATLRREISSKAVNGGHSQEIETLKANHEHEINALKMSIKVLEGSRGSLQEVDDQQGLYQKISELEASLSAKVRALASERKNAERLRASISDLERSKTDLWLQKDASEEKLKAITKDYKETMAAEALKREEMSKKHAEERAELLQAEEQKRMELLRQEEQRYEELLTVELEKRERVVRDFERRTHEMLVTHEAEKTAMSSEHENVLRAMEDKLLADAMMAAAEYRKSLEVKDSRHRELEASLAQMRRASLDDRATLEARHRDEKLAFEKERETLESEYQAIISRGEKTLENERKTLAAERSAWDVERTKLAAEFEARLEKELLVVQSELNTVKTQKQEELEELQKEIRSQKEDMECRIQSICKDSERKLRELADSHRKREEQWKTQQAHDKDAAAKFVRELQNQKEEEERKKQNLLDKIAKVEVSKESVEEELATVKGNYERSVAAARQLNEKLSSERSRSKALEDNVADLAEKLRKSQDSVSEGVTDYKLQLQEKDKAYNDLYTRRKRQIEDLELDIRNSDTKITMLEVELESVKKTVFEKEETIQGLKDNGATSETEIRKKFEVEIKEKDFLIDSLRRTQDEASAKHEQKVEALLSTIGKLEETCNKTRLRGNEDARIAEARFLEQQNLVTTWQSVANKRIEEIERLEKSVEEATAKADSHRNDLKTLKADIKQLEKEIRTHKSEIKNLTKELKTANDERSELRKNLAAAKSLDAGAGNSTDGGNSGRLARKLSELEKINDQLIKEIDSYKAEVTNYMTDTHELDSKLKEYEDNLRHLENEAQRKDAELERLQKLGRSPSGLTNGNSVANTNGESSSSNTSSPEVSVNRLKKDLGEANQEIERLREKIESYEIEYRIMFTEHERLKAIGEGHLTSTQMSQMIDSLEKELDRTKRAKRDFEMRLQSAELRLATTGNLGQGSGRSQSSMSYVRPHGDIYEDDEGNSR